MADTRGGSNRGGGDPFYNKTVQFGKDSEVSFATIIMGAVAFLFFTGSTFISGLMSGFGILLLLVAVVIWASIEAAKMGIWKSVSFGISFFIATLFINYLVFDYVPSMILEADMNKWNQVGSQFQSNSPIVNQPMNGVTIPDFSGNSVSGQDSNVGGGSPVVYATQPPVYNVPDAPQATPEPYVAPTVSPTAGLERQLEQAILESDGYAILEITAQILTIDPNNVDAKLWNTQAVSEKMHVDGLDYMPQPTGDFMATVDNNNVETAYNILADNGEMEDGYQYVILDNGAKFGSVSCNQTSLLKLNNGLFEGKTFTAQRCLISDIAGGSDNGDVFTIR